MRVLDPEYAPTSIERVRVVPDDGSRPFTVWIEVIREADRLLQGYEVDHQGERISGKDFDQRLRVIDKSLITRRTRFAQSKKYGDLLGVGETRFKRAQIDSSERS